MKKMIPLAVAGLFVAVILLFSGCQAATGGSGGGDGGLNSTTISAFSRNVLAADYTQGVNVSGNAAIIWFNSTVATTWVDVHYKVNSGTMQNVRMTYNSSSARYEQGVDFADRSVLQYFFTYNNGSSAYDTPAFTFSRQTSGTVSNGVYKITSKCSGKVLDVKDISMEDGAKMQQWISGNGNNQKFSVELQADNYYKITAQHSGKVLDVPNGSHNDGVQLQQCFDNGSDAQRWQIIDAGNGYYKVISKASGLLMDVANASTADGAAVQQYTDNGTDAQRWSFSLVSNPDNPTSGSIYSIPASSIPNPTGNGAISVKVMNGTNGAYADNNIYWCVIGINPATGAWSYLDLSGNLVPISAALNDASSHLTKNGVNYANIYYTVSETSWVNLPQITSGRMFLSVGSPCYIKTYDNGFAGPNINNSTDPNRDVYFDFVEFTVNASGYHGNTTRVDQFGFPVQHRLVNKAGNYDQTVGELESETRAGLFTKYQNEVPTEFKSLGTLQAPYRIVCPISGPFNTGGAYAYYFSGYTSISTRDILLGIGGASNPQTCAAINRHIYHDTANWNTVSKYYQVAPANYYAKFWHDHNINGLAYGFCYDDVNGQAAYLEIGDPKGLIIRAGW
jgi:hypothetical protein